MKKIFIGLAVLVLSSCYLKGDYTLGQRNVFNDFFYTYNIRYYDPSSFNSTSVETETISDYTLGMARHAVPGGLVAASKTVQKQVYSDEYVRPNVKGAMVSYTVPVEFSDEKVYQTIGETEIKGVTYRLIKPNRVGDVILIDENGVIYPRIGRIYNDRLALLETSFLLEPDGAYFMSEVKNRTGEETVISGFEVRYGGIENYRMVFKYFTVEPNGEFSTEGEKVYTFPMYDKEVSFEGIKLEILNANESGIDYRVLEI